MLYPPPPPYTYTFPISNWIPKGTYQKSQTSEPVLAASSTTPNSSLAGIGPVDSAPILAYCVPLSKALTDVTLDGDENKFLLSIFPRLRFGIEKRGPSWVCDFIRRRIEADDDGQSRDDPISDLGFQLFRWCWATWQTLQYTWQMDKGKTVANENLGIAFIFLTKFYYLKKKVCNTCA